MMMIGLCRGSNITFCDQDFKEIDERPIPWRPSDDKDSALWDEVTEYVARQSIIRRGLKEIFQDIAQKFQIAKK